MNPNSPIYVVVLLAHAGSALVGFGSVALAGFYAPRLANGEDEGRRFFGSKRIVSRSMVFATALFGVSLLFLSAKPAVFLRYPWLRFGIVLYLAATFTVIFFIWPIERRLSEAIRVLEPNDFHSIKNLCVSLGRRCALVDVLVAVTLLLMVTQPGR